MTITLELPADVEAKLRENAARGDADAVRRLLADAVGPTVAALLRDAAYGDQAPPPDGLSDAEFDALLDQLSGEWPLVLPTLPDEAVTRDGIYAEHP